jgi:hypothetical protein
VYLAVVEVLFAVVLGLSFDDSYGTVPRSLWASVYALVPTIGIAVVTLGVGYLLNRRSFRHRLREGVVLEAGFGDRFLVLRGPWAETTLSFDGIASVRSRGEWVFLQQRGSPVLSVWPEQLFPSAALTRLRRSVDERKS